MIRAATLKDLPQIMPLYDIAREFMRKNGNPTQWGNGYPSEKRITDDIENGNFYVEETDECLTGCFAFIIGEEPTYGSIQGSWLDNQPYGTIHRLASSGQVQGVAYRCIAFCRSRIAHLRADTHQDNRPMQHILKCNGFRYCGIIHIADGTPRLAYQLLPSTDLNPIPLTTND